MPSYDVDGIHDRLKLFLPRENLFLLDTQAVYDTWNCYHMTGDLSESFYYRKKKNRGPKFVLCVATGGSVFRQEFHLVDGWISLFCVDCV